LKPVSFEIDTKISATAEVIQEKVMARNVIGYLEGSDPVLKSSYVVIGAHYDHLGMGGTGSGSRFMDSLAIHNGADDNASGVAGVLELAASLGSDEPAPRRSVIFIAFDGEELGLLGSKYYVNHPVFTLKDAVAMINFDMIGRLKQDNPGIMIGGTGTSAESEDLLNSLDSGNIQLNFSPEGFGPSDHAAFYGENIPVFFFSTGAHEDYHTPDDDWDRLNFEGEKEILEIAEELVVKLADRDSLLTFREAGPKEQEGRAGYRFKVTLGIMPDFTSTTETGLGVGGVKKDGPAFKGGILKGDVITAIDGKQINDIYDYMNRLKKLQPGQRISVDILRGDKKEILIIQL
jgi:aminopeptidase YwaD